jgi:UDP-N-acetylmuramate-alanine ligase
VACRDQKIAEVELPIPGRQNVVNALAAFAVAEELGVPAEKIVAALGEFTGAKRRFERTYEGAGVVVVDDYAHHPTEIRATLAAARTLGFQRVLVAFQPHRYTRTQALLAEFARAFDDADKVIFTEIYTAGELPIDGVTGQGVFEATVAALGERGGQQGDGEPSRGHRPRLQPESVQFAPDLGQLAERLFQEAQPGDLILTMGAGNIYQTAEWLSERFAQRAPPVRSAQRQAMNIESDLKTLLAAEARLRTDEPMAKHTTLRVGGPARSGSSRGMSAIWRGCSTTVTCAKFP